MFADEEPPHTPHNRYPGHEVAKARATCAALIALWITTPTATAAGSNRESALVDGSVQEKPSVLLLAH